MQTLSGAPSAKSAQTLPAGESERFEWLRPSGSTIYAVNVTTANAINAPKSAGWSSVTCTAAVARHVAPTATTAATYARAVAGNDRKVGVSGLMVLIRLSRAPTPHEGVTAAYVRA